MKSPLQNDGEIKQLIADCILQKRNAQYQFFKRYFSSMMNVCLRYANSREEAEDMLNEGFVKIFANLDKYEEIGSFEAWLRQVMAHSAIDYRRKQPKNEVIEFEEAITEQNLDFSIHNQAIGKMSYDELVACVQQLPETSRTVFNLYVFENYSHKQIAELLDMKEGTSHWHLNFARNKLKTLIDRENY